MSRKYKFLSLTLLLTISAFVYFQNCSNPTNFFNSSLKYDSQGRLVYTSEALIQSQAGGPPVDLFFVVDNSGSMLNEQTQLKNSINALFDKQTNSMAALDTRIYIITTNSTVHSSDINPYFSYFPTQDPKSLTSLALASDFTHYFSTPGGVFSFWQKSYASSSSNYNQYLPASVPLNDSGQIAFSIFVPKRQAQQTDQDYTNMIQSLKSKFAQQMDSLNPNYQLNSSGQSIYQTVTDHTKISSGLCSISRVLRHKDQFITPGDAGAFIVLSDDNDRLNDRNPASNLCLETYGKNLEAGSCSNYQFHFQYNVSPKVNYQKNTRFQFNKSYNVEYIVEDHESCAYKVKQTGTYDYLAFKYNDYTQVQFTNCNSVVDNTCTNQSIMSIQIPGNQTSSGNCLANISSQISSMTIGPSNVHYSPINNSPFTCNYIAQPATNTSVVEVGTDSSPDGINCSATLISTLKSKYPSFSSCTITGQHFNIASTGNLAPGKCSTYCSDNKLTDCTIDPLNITRVNSGLLTKNYPTVTGTDQTSFCAQNPSICNQIGFIYLGAYPTDVIKLKVNSAVDQSYSKLSCSGLLPSGVQIFDINNTQICATSTSINDCITSLGGNPSNCSYDSLDNYNDYTYFDITDASVDCSSVCNSKDCDPKQYTSYADFVNKKYYGQCSRVTTTRSNAEYTLNFANTNNVNCSSPCSSSLNGSCNGSSALSISDYIKSQFGGSCSGFSANLDTSTTINITSGSCPSDHPVFTVSSDPNQTFVNGLDSNHQGSKDYLDFIKSQSSNVFGPGNTTFAAITQLKGDILPGNFVGDQPVEGLVYEQLALQSNPDSPQIYSILQDYSQALGQISRFISMRAINTLDLTKIDSNKVLVGIKLKHLNNSDWKSIDSSMYKLTGQHLVLDPSLSLQVGDIIQYDYRDK